MEQKDALIIIGGLYVKTWILTQEIEKKNQELQELRNIIITLQKSNGTLSS